MIVILQIKSNVCLSVGLFNRKIISLLGGKGSDFPGSMYFFLKIFFIFFFVYGKNENIIDNFEIPGFELLILAKYLTQSNLSKKIHK